MVGWVRRWREACARRRQDRQIAAEAYPLEVAGHLQRIADDFGLSYELDLDGPVELSLTFPRQPGLQREIWVSLQNTDEVWFMVDGFTYSSFPYPKVWPTFEAHLTGVIRGTFMVQHQGATSHLKSLEDSGWTRVASSISSFSSGLFRNDPKAREGGLSG